MVCHFFKVVAKVSCSFSPSSMNELTFSSCMWVSNPSIALNCPTPFTQLQKFNLPAHTFAILGNLDPCCAKGGRLSGTWLVR
eukprot:m.29159 g.29159  ORF g.29159 m.29159 type:complete len:82 (-) comp6655_c0_seq1:4147-4392(-)